MKQKFLLATALCATVMGGTASCGNDEGVIIDWIPVVLEVGVTRVSDGFDMLDSAKGGYNIDSVFIECDGYRYSTSITNHFQPMELKAGNPNKIRFWGIDPDKSANTDIIFKWPDGTSDTITYKRKIWHRNNSNKRRVDDVWEYKGEVLGENVTQSITIEK